MLPIYPPDHAGKEKRTYQKQIETTYHLVLLYPPFPRPALLKFLDLLLVLYTQIRAVACIRRTYSTTSLSGFSWLHVGLMLFFPSFSFFNRLYRICIFGLVYNGDGGSDVRIGTTYLLRIIV